MLFTKTIASLLAVAGFGGVALAAPASSSSLEVRDDFASHHDSSLLTRDDSSDSDSDGLFRSLDIDDDVWEALGKLCREGAGAHVDTKRDLFVRASKPDGFDEIKPGNYDGKFKVVPGGLWTDFLVSCHGIVVTGESANPVAKNRFLGHSFATAAALDDMWSKMKKDIEGAGLSNIKAYLSVPDLSNDLPNSWDDDLTDAAKKVEQTMTTNLKSLTGSVVVKTHKMKESSAKTSNEGTMQVAADLKVQINGQDVTQ
ncbi:hypothetical protein F4809DRAFT_606416 [Biscogniauxia mediterranea]|nr:hypothetical protein F4809DRAFT_606416 [Biscogniauxia mediterranea]